MKRLILTIMLMGIIYVLAQNVYTELTNDMPAALLLSGISSTHTEEKIMQHFMRHIEAEGVSKIDATDFSIETQYVDINTDGKKDIVAIMHATNTCSTVGCMSSIFLQNEAQEFNAIKHFLYTVKSIEVLDTYTQNMRDLRINNDTTTRLIWNGSTYVLERI